MLQRLMPLIGLLAIAGAATHADTVNLPADRDNTMFSESDTLSNGAGDYFFAGRVNGPELRRGLLRFDLSSIPAGSTITSVELTLYLSRGKQGGQKQRFVELHRCLADWGEGASDADAEEGAGATALDQDATWRYTFYDAATPASSPEWTSLGGDYAATASASIIANSVGQFYTWGSTANMVADAQFWLDNPGSNFGWVLIGNEAETQTARRFDSRTNPTTANRPALTVIFDPPAGAEACCFTDGSCQNLSPTDCTNAGGTPQGTGTDCATTNCPQPQVACCFSDQACQDLPADQCTSAGGTSQGAGTSCAVEGCPVGACCSNDASALCTEVTEFDCNTAAGVYEGDATLCAETRCPVVLTRYLDALPVPGVATPTTGVAGGEATYDIEIVQVQQQLHTELPPTTVWGYEGLFPGPTIEAYQNMPVTVNWINDLRDSQGNLRTDHFLDVDLCPHGAENLAKVVTHLHGGHVPADVDGYPEDTFLPGFSDSYLYPNYQEAATLWCHDHALGITRLNVMMGLAMFYIVRDDNESALNLPTYADGYEIPIAIQDRTFNPDGSLYYTAADPWNDHFFGDTAVLNGKAWPYLNVDQGKYRLRLLNGCTSRTVTLALDNGRPFTLIGLEGGLLEAPVVLNELTIAPGERRDVIVDFEGLSPGTEVILTNSAPPNYSGSPGATDLPELMKFIVQNAPGDTDPVPATLNTIDFFQEADAELEREFILRKQFDPCTGKDEWLINDLHWNDITELPRRGATEIWSFANASGVMHPMHMHLVFFQVLDRDTFTLGPNDEIIPDGNPVGPAPDELGWKDTVQVNANELVRVIARFDDYTGLYPYHCHILEHEDHEMMRQFQVVPPVCVGDIDDDGDTDVFDFGLFATAFGSSIGDPNYLPNADLDNNGVIDVFDFGLFGPNFGCVG